MYANSPASDTRIAKANVLLRINIGMTTIEAQDAVLNLEV